MRRVVLLPLLLSLGIGEVASQAHGEDRDPVLTPHFEEHDFIVKNFVFRSGESLAQLRIHYRTFGNPRKDVGGHIVNGVILLHGTTGSGEQFLQPGVANFLFPPGMPLDASRYFLIVPDDIGCGKSSRPSEGLRARFPHFGYRDMVEAQHRLVTDALGIEKLRLVLGTSMGGMHTWLWGEAYPNAAEALVPIGSLPVPVRGRNLLWRRIIIDAIRNDPQFHGGDYQEQPPALAASLPIFLLMTDSPDHLDGEPFGDADEADASLKRMAEMTRHRFDANNLISQFEASRDYDPSAGLEKISSRLLAINFADDELYLADSGILEREIKRVKHGQAVTIPKGPKTRGHQTLGVPEVWGPVLAKWLEEDAHAGK